MTNESNSPASPVTLEQHTKAVGDWLNELYAVMVDPCAEGVLTIKQMCDAIMASAELCRELAGSQDAGGAARQGEAVAPEARADVLKQLRTAMDVVSALCDGSMRWTMSVPARPDSDPDLVISGALHAAEKLIAAAPPAPPAPLPGKRERALFQAWARDRHWNLSLRADGERYMSESTQEGWYAWKGRAALSSPPALEAAPADYPPPQKYDDVLVPFVAAMRKELHANSGKGDRPGWLAMDANTALLEVYWHAAKLSAAVKNNDGPAIQEHSADVANMAMMVLDICGGLAWVEVAADRAQRSGVSADPLPLTDTYVQPVPDKCDRITWRGQYYHLPVSSQSQPLVEPTADRKSLNAMAADLLRPYLKEGQKVIWREAFRWQDDNGVLSNHYDGMELEQLADDFGYDWRYDMNFKHAAIVWNKVAASPQHQVKKGELS